MASFRGHLVSGIAASSAGSLAVTALGWVHLELAPVYFVLGVFGGLLPDIDAPDSIVSRVLFTLLAFVAAFLAWGALSAHLGPVELLFVCALLFVLVRIGLFRGSALFAGHRGVWHSWLGVALAGFAATNVASRGMGLAAFEAWLAGAFVAAGYLIHLCHDEIASVDIFGNRIKRSFGSALKPFSFSDTPSSLMMLAGIIALAANAPPLRPALDVIGSSF